MCGNWHQLGGPSGASAAIVVAGSITPAGWIALGVAATVTAGVVAYSHYRTRNTITYSKKKPDKHAGDNKNAHFHAAVKRKERNTYKRVTKHDHYYYPRRRQL